MSSPAAAAVRAAVVTPPHADAPGAPHHRRDARAATASPATPVPTGDSTGTGATDTDSTHTGATATGAASSSAAQADVPEGDAAAGAGGGQAAQSCGGAIQTVADAERLVTEAAGCQGGANTYWQGELGEAWTTPRLVPYRNGEVPNDACGEHGTPAQFANNALYCTLDDTIAYSTDFLADLASTGGPAYPLFVLMHELAHRGDRIAGTVGVVTRAEENQADCFAGRQAAAAQSAGRINLGDAMGGAMLFFSLGDTRGGWYDQEPASDTDAHGTPMQRSQAFSLGYLRDSATCHGIGQSRTGEIPA